MQQANPTAETLAKLERFLAYSDDSKVLVGIEEIIEEARNGRMFILVDDEDRENEGDLVIPGQMATPDAINFMAMHGRGLICLALTKDRVDHLGLTPMSRNNKESMQTAFTISIEAKEGVTTGISAADRARTISVAIDAAKGADDLVTPGHVFPLMARDGGTLVRAGHTEAAVDISRLAGLNPSGVICEIMNEDGTMARLDDLITFARRHDMKIGTIRDLIAGAQRGGGSYVEYEWRKPSLGTAAPKLGYVTAFPRWNWMVGTGLYLDDIQTTMASLDRQISSNVTTTLLWIAGIAALCLAAVPFAFGSLRSGGMGKRLFLGIVFALAFMLLQMLFGRLAGATRIDYRFAYTLPPVLMLVVSWWLFRRKSG